MPMSTMLKGLSRMSSASASTRTWPAISPAVRFRTRPIFPVRQNAQAMAHPTWVEMQKVIDGVSGMNTDSICRPSARRSRNFSVPSTERSRATSSGVVSEKSAREALAELAREVRHRGDVGDAAAIDPAEDLAGAKPLVAAFLERRFERRPVQIGEVGAAGRHGICPVSNHLADQRILPRMIGPESRLHLDGFGPPC